MDEEERKLRESIMDCLAISGEYNAEWTNGYIDIGPETIMSVVNDLVDLIRRREKSMTTLSDLTPLLQKLHAAQSELQEAFTTVNKALRPEGYSLYWDDSEERYCIYALPQLLDGTYQKGQASEGT